MPQSQKTKWFRVATEGATTDGRAIQRSWIEQMAKNFNPAKYGARVWIEHMRGLLPDSAFAAQGDVLAVKAQTVEDGKLALYAQIQPLESLLAMNKAGQKLYTSIEVDPNFADTGQAYLVGLAVTDSPASLGTELLTFAQQNPGANPLAGRKLSKDNLFTASIEFSLELEDAPAPATASPLSAALEKFNTLLAKAMGHDSTPPAPTAPLHRPPGPAQTDFTAALVATQAIVQAFSQQQAQDSQALAALQQQLNQLQAQHQGLVTQLSAQPQDPQRPTAAGGNGQELAEF
ncbi:GPO family capsid scaffolding protein [Comamonas nitrativorans]|uniref:GPO family capsid scaffolding protein n=1 Tax=Comamonas nitrativorans TaxID=108437 RepID=A0ABV9H0Q3_9BURK